MTRHRRLARLAWAGAIALALASAALYVAYQSDRRLLAQLAEQVDAGRLLTDEQRLVAYVDFTTHELRNPRFEEIESWPVRLYYHLNPLHPGPGDVLRWGSDYRGPCGSHARVLVAMLQSRGMDVHPLLLLNQRGNSIHTVTEATIGGRPVVADGDFGIVFRRRDGALAGAMDLAADTTFFRAQVETIPGYPRQYNYDSTTALNWRKIPVLLPAVHALLVKILGPERVKEMRRPGIWMWPQAFYSLACLMLSICLAVLGWLLSRLGPTPGTVRHLHSKAPGQEHGRS